MVFRLKPGSALGTFSKGIAGAVSVNFGASGGANCDVGCKHHPESTARDPTNACYAVTVEQRGDRKALATKLQRHQKLGAAQVVGKALLELQQLTSKRKRIPWIRISTNGSVPQPGDMTPLFASQFRALLNFARSQAIPVHLPVETPTKARIYRKLFGDLATVRESADDVARFLRARVPVSCTAGKPGTSYRLRIAAARKLAARKRKRSGRKVVVCPAVLNTFVSRGKGNEHKRNKRAKCGVCVACACPDTDIVYPLH